MNLHIKVRHPEWLKHSTPGKTIQMFNEGRLPDSVAGWMLVTSLKHPLRCIYGSDLRAAWALLLEALWNKVKRIWDDVAFRFRRKKNLDDLLQGESEVTTKEN